MRNLLLALLMILTAQASHAFVSSRAYDILPHSKSQKAKDKNEGMLSLHRTLSLTQFYIDILGRSPQIATIKRERQIYNRLISPLYVTEMYNSPKYVRRFAQKWRKEIELLQAPSGELISTDELLTRLYQIEHFLAADIKLLENRFKTPKGVVSISNATAIVEAAKELKADILNDKIIASVTESVKSQTAPHLISIIDDVIKTRPTKETIELVDSLSLQLHKKENSPKDLLIIDFKIKQLTRTLKINSNEVHSL